MKVDKKEVIKTLTKDLKSLLKVLVESAMEAKDAATNEESKAENKYDTRGLEASYLAGAQAKRAEELERSIEYIEKLKIEDLDEEDSIEPPTLIEALVDDEETKYFLIFSCAGGSKVVLKDLEVLVITPESPLGEQLMGKKLGDVVELQVKKKITEYEIIDLI